MNKIDFFFLSTFLLIVTVFAGLETVDTSVQLLSAVLFIVLLGIPHGAIDHIIFLEDNKRVSPLHFYLFYFGLMGMYLFTWMVFPVFSLILFLILSAYHFGQSQFSELTANQTFGSHLLYFFWGCSILSGLIFYHIEEILLFSSTSVDLQLLSVVFDKDVFSILLPVSSLFSLLILLKIWQNQQLSSERFFFEIYLFALIHISFYILPLVVGFTLYFVILHSFKVLSEEFRYLKKRRKIFSLGSFIKILLPFTLVSILGGGIIMVCAHYNLIGISNVLLVFVLISVLTLPHSVVMNHFYQKFMRKPA